MRPCAGRSRALRESAWERSSRNSEEISGRTSRALPCPAIRSTESSDSPYMTRWVSIPGWAQKNRPVRSVIVATVGQRTTCVRRRRASTTVTAGYVETTTSGSCSAIERASGREPSRHSSLRASTRTGATLSSSQ